MNAEPAFHCARRRRAAAAVASAGLLLPAWAAAQPGAGSCGPLQQLAFDYRTDQKQYKVVEEFHFTPEVEALIRGKSGTLGQELNYTLTNVPNHHRALVAVRRYGEKMKSPKPADLRYPVECYFERALRFRPDDNVARLLYAQYLVADQRAPQAVQHLELAAASAKDNGFTHYNIGLLFLELKAYDRALQQAHTAAALGFARPGLKEQLQAAGRWREPPVAASSAALGPAGGASAVAAPAPAPGTPADAPPASQ